MEQTKWLTQLHAIVCPINENFRIFDFTPNLLALYFLADSSGLIFY